MVEEQKRELYSNRKKPDPTVPLFLHESLATSDPNHVEEESCCSAHSTLVSDQNTTFTALKLHGNVMTLKGTKLASWPSSTEVACWYDTFPFSGTPIPLPHHFDEQKRAYVIYGNVCSVECALAYMHREGRHHDLWERVVLFEDMMNAVFHVKTAGREPAPPFLTLSRFGGFFSIDEYRASFQTVQMNVITPPFIMYPLVIQEKHKKAVSQTHSADPEQETVLSTGHVLRGLRRPQKVCTPAATPAPVSVAARVVEPHVLPVAPRGSGTETVAALSLSSDEEDRVPPCEPMEVCSVPPLSTSVSSVQADADLLSRITQSGRGRGRGRGRGSSNGSSNNSGGRSQTRHVVGGVSTPSNTMLTSFLVVNKK